jgi:spore coat protein CotH
MAVEDMLGFSDGYMTMADNYYVYNDPENPGRMIYIPTDMDTTLGISLFETSLMESGNYSEHPGFNLRPLTSKLFSNRGLLRSYQDKFKKLSQSLVNPSVMDPFIDNIVQVIQPDVDWDLTLPRLGEASVQGLNISGIDTMGNFSDFLPPGFKTNLSDMGNVGTVDSVKEFLSEKSTNVRAFYNVTN